jgi:succinoglycan biosynthesis transport protein ExoP
LTELLRVEDPSEELTASRLVRVAPNTGLYILPAGNAPDKVSNLLYSARLPKLLERLREEFDAVLIDSPPMLQAPDARILARVTGAAVLVIRAGHTSRDTAAAAKQRFAEDGTAVLGTILNDWNGKS